MHCSWRMRKPTLSEKASGMLSSVWMPLTCQSACFSILMSCWQVGPGWLGRNLNCNEELNEAWVCVSYHRRRQCWLGSLSPHKMLKQSRLVLLLFLLQICSCCCCIHSNRYFVLLFSAVILDYITPLGYVFVFLVRYGLKLEEQQSHKAAIYMLAAHASFLLPALPWSSRLPQRGFCW